MPALREELVTALIRSLPKQLRRNFVPAPDVARAVLARLEPGREPLVEALARELRRASGQDVPISAFDWAKVPAHLRATFRVTDGAKTVAQGKDLEQLQRRLGRTVQDVLSDAARSLERTGLTDAGRSARCRARSRAAAWSATRRWSTGARPSTLHRAADRGRSSAPRTGPAYGGCCCSACRPR